MICLFNFVVGLYVNRQGRTFLYSRSLKLVWLVSCLIFKGFVLPWWIIYLSFYYFINFVFLADLSALFLNRIICCYILAYYDLLLMCLLKVLRLYEILDVHFFQFIITKSDCINYSEPRFRNVFIAQFVDEHEVAIASKQSGCDCFDFLLNISAAIKRRLINWN